MAVSLTKGQKVDLTKGNPGLTRIMVGLGWDTNRYDGGADFDLDAAAFLLGANGKVSGDPDFVFYGNLKHIIRFYRNNRIITENEIPNSSNIWMGSRSCDFNHLVLLIDGTGNKAKIRGIMSQHTKNILILHDLLGNCGGLIT